MFGAGIVYRFLNFLLTVIGDLGSYCVGRGDNFPSLFPAHNRWEDSHVKRWETPIVSLKGVNHGF